MLRCSFHNLYDCDSEAQQCESIRTYRVFPSDMLLHVVANSFAQRRMCNQMRKK